MADTSVLQIGATDWTPQIDTSRIDWHYTTILDLPTQLTFQKDPYVLEQTYVLLTDDSLSSTLLSSQISEWPALRTIYFANQVTPAFQKILDERRAFHIKDSTTPEAVINFIENDLSFDQIGFSTRFSETQFLPIVPEGVHFKREGRFSTQFSGDFGNEWQQIGTLNPFSDDFSAHLENVVWLDYEQTQSAAVQLRFTFFKDNHIQTTQIISGDMLRQQSVIGNINDYQNYQILVFAKGQGMLDLHVLHQRRNRHGFGTLLPGDNWRLTANNEEVLSYFNPGDRKAPLVVNFSDVHLNADGFDMRESLNELGTPYLLFSDVRMQSGVFHIGIKTYETQVIETIKKAMATLDLQPEDIILTGSAMGSLPAMYYAADLKPHAVVVTKPIINLGTFTANTEFPHEVNQDWTLDVRRFLAGRMHPNDTETLNNIFWEHIQNVDWSQIKVSLLTLNQDEYDGQSLPKLLDFLKLKKVPLTHRREDGTHTAKTPEILTFLKKQLTILKNSMRQEDQ